MRRRVHVAVLGGVALLAAALPACAAPRVWDFRASLDDAPIGYHRFTLSEDGDARKLKSESRFEVRFLFMTAYRYSHDATERWRGNCLESLHARTDDNGQRSKVEAMKTDDLLAVTTAGTRETLPDCVMSFAYWNPQMLRQSRLLNAQTGSYEAVNIAALGEQSITVRGAAVAARHYRVSGAKNPIELWYSADGEWLALESIVAGGRRLRYTLN